MKCVPASTISNPDSGLKLLHLEHGNSGFPRNATPCSSRPTPTRKLQPCHLAGSLPWKWPRGDRWAEPTREVKERPSSLDFGSSHQAHPAFGLVTLGPTKCPAVPGIQLLSRPPACHTLFLLGPSHIPLLYNPGCPLLWDAWLGPRSCGSLSHKEGTARPHLRPALSTVW